MPKKCLLLLLDGIGDRQYAELGGLTPLQAAHTPNLDRLARLGGNGLYHAGFLGEPLPSENAHFALFGYPDEQFPGRGPVEALGAGLDLREGEVAMLAHFVSAEERDGGLFVARDRPGSVRPDEERALFDTVGRFEYADVGLTLHQTKGLFGVLVLSGPVSPLITDSNPMRDNAFATDVVPAAEGGSDPAASRCAEAVRAFLSWTHRRLEDSGLNRERRRCGLEPINAIVTQRAGRMASVEPFSSRTGLRGCCVASGALYLGLASLLAMRGIEVPGSNDAGADFGKRLDTAAGLLSDFDFLHVHTKAPDEAAHSGSCRRKRDAISALDLSLGPHMELLARDPEILTVVGSDHSTPSSGAMIHSGEPVPVLMRGETVRRDRVEAFGEVEAACGALGPVRGTELMRLVLNGLDLAKMRGVRDVTRERLYWPGPAPAFRLP